MAVELASAYISLVPSAKGIGRSISRELDGPLNDAGRRAGDSSSSAFSGRFTAGLRTAAKHAGIALGVAFGAAGTYGVKVAADFQQTRIAFTGILGSAEEADKRLKELQQFAAGTPFEFAGLAESAQQLLAVGFGADEILPTMTKLGNVAATLGVGEAEIKGVVRALGQMRGKGKASAEELQQISEQIPGFSAIQAIAEDMGISTADAFKEMAEGGISADRAIDAILRGMEKFPGAAGAMERQSKTLNGVLSTFKDTINIALIEGIEPFLPAISGALQGAIPIVERFIDFTIGGVAAVVTGFGDIVDAVGDFWTEINAGDVGGGIAVEIGKLVGLAEDHPIVSALATALNAVGDAGRWAFEQLSGVVGFVTSEVTSSVNIAKDAWSAYARDGVGPVASAFESIQDVIGEVNDGLREQKDILIPAAAAAGAFAAAFVTYAQVSRAVTAVTSAATLLGPAISAALAPLIASPVGIIVAIIAAIAAAFVAAYFTIQPFRDAVDGLVDILGDLAGRAVAFVSELMDRAIPAIAGFAESVVDIASSIAEGFREGLRTLGGIIQRNLVNPLRPLGRFLTREVRPAFSAFGDFVAALFARIADVVGPAVVVLRAVLEFLASVLADIVGPAFAVAATYAEAAFKIIQTVITTVANILAPILATAFDAVVTAVDLAWGYITAIIQAAFNIIEGIFDVLAGILTGDFARVWEGLVGIVSAPVLAVRDVVVNTFEELGGFLGSLPGRFGDFITAIFGGAVAIATTIFDSIANTVTTTFDGITEFIGGLPAKIGELASGMWDGIAEAFENVINFIIGAWNSLQFKLPSFDGWEVAGREIIPSFEGPTLGVPLIDPVDFAHGGIVKARPGGLLARLGEAGRDEAVIPLPADQGMSALGFGAQYNVTLNYPVPESEEDGVLRALRRASAEAA